MSSALALAIAGLLAQVLGYALYGAPRGPDIPLGAAAVVGTFCLAVSVLCAQLSWGYALGRAFRREAPLWERYLWGASLTMLLLGTLGFAPVVGEGARLGWRLFLLLGCALAFVLASRRVPAVAVPYRPRFADLAAAGALLFATLGAARPRPFWDSLWYHLTGARLWFEAGRVYLPPRLPIAFQNGLWDYHFLLGQILLGGGGGGGLIAAQLFGQWLSVGVALFLYLLLRSRANRLSLSPFAAFTGLAGTELFFEAEFAKNDWAVALWSVAAAVFLRERRFPAAAFVAGLAFAIKLSAAFFLLPWALWFAWELRRDAGRLAAGAALALLGAAPILLRNFFLTANPFFPAFAGWFPSPLQGPSWGGFSAYSAGFPGPREWLVKGLALARDSAGTLGLLAAPRWLRHLGPDARAPFAAALASLAILFFGFGVHTEWRFAGGGLVLAAAYGGRCAELALGAFGRVGERWGRRALLVAGLLWYPLDWAAPLGLVRAPDPAVQVRGWTAGMAMAWVRQHAVPGSAAATLNETKIYYLFPGEPRRAFDDPELDRALAGAKSPEELPGLFRARGIRYLVLSAEFIDRAYDRRICDWAYELSERHPEAVPVRGDLSRVLDLQALKP